MSTWQLLSSDYVSLCFIDSRCHAYIEKSNKLNQLTTKRHRKYPLNIILDNGKTKLNEQDFLPKLNFVQANDLMYFCRLIQSH